MARKSVIPAESVLAIPRRKVSSSVVPSSRVDQPSIGDAVSGSMPVKPAYVPVALQAFTRSVESIGEEIVQNGTYPDCQPSIRKRLASFDIDDTNIEIEVNIFLVFPNVVTVQLTINPIGTHTVSGARG